MENLDYVARIKSARVYDVARVTALDRAQSREIARALDETLNLQMTTAEERRRFMY